MNNLAQYPYLIVAPDYSEASAGVQVLHFFCQTINNSGGKAWIVGGTVNPKWNTPRLTEEDYAQLQHAGEPWIAVYPEVTSGNPLRAPVVVRYMLNREGVMNGNRLDFSPDDLFFWYREEFADKEYERSILNMENYDLELFTDDRAEKDLDLLYINRLPHSVIEFDQLPKNLTILSMQNPLTLKELAAVLKRGRVMYSYESSGTCLLAVLCGCPVVGLTAPGFENYALNEKTIRDNGNGGYALVNTPEAIAEAKATGWKAREFLLKKREISQRLFDEFIHKTQAVAQQKATSQYMDTLQGWLENRRLPAEEIQTDGVRFLFVIISPESDTRAINATLDSLLPQLAAFPGSGVIVVADDFLADASDAFRQMSAQNYAENVARLLRTGGYEWLQVVPAGTRYAKESLRLLSVTLQQLSTVQAVYTDEALSYQDGRVTDFLKPDFNLDLFLSAPFRYLRRIFFRAESWLACGGWGAEYRASYEFDLVIKLMMRHGISALAHCAEIITITEHTQFDVQDADEDAAIINQYATWRGLPVQQVTFTAQGCYQRHYSARANIPVSIILTGVTDAGLLTRCVASLIDNTEWDNYEILIPVLTHEHSGVLETALEVEKLLPGKARVIACNHGNEVQLINAIAEQSPADALLLMNVHTVFVLRSWLSTLATHFVRPDVGCAGPKIISLNKTLLSAGRIVGADGWMADIGSGEAWQAAGPQSRYQCEQNYTVLNGQCLLIGKNVFTAVGGLDEKYTSLSISVSALCLKLKTQGYVSVWTPYSIIATDDTSILASTGRDTLCAEREMLIAEFPQFFANDPAYNRHFSLASPLFRLDACYTRTHRPLQLKKKAKVVVIMQGNENAYTARLTNYLSTMETLGCIALCLFTTITDGPTLLRCEPDVVIFQGPCTDDTLSALSFFKRLLTCPFHYFIDGTTDAELPKGNMLAFPFDKWLVISAAQEKWAKSKGVNSLRIPPFVPEAWFSTRVHPEAGRRCRALCSISGLTTKERDFIRQVIEKTHHSVDWFVMGDVPPAWNKWVSGTFKYHPDPVSVAVVDSVNPDIALFFRDNNQHHRYSDGYQLLQFAARGIALLCSDTPSFDGYDFATKLKAKESLWVDAINQYALGKQRQRESNEATVASIKARYMFNPENQQALLTMLQ